LVAGGIPAGLVIRDGEDKLCVCEIDWLCSGDTPPAPRVVAVAGITNVRTVKTATTTALANTANTRPAHLAARPHHPDTRFNSSAADKTRLVFGMFD
jgi:hypothetical protein